MAENGMSDLISLRQFYFPSRDHGLYTGHLIEEKTQDVLYRRQDEEGMTSRCALAHNYPGKRQYFYQACGFHTLVGVIARSIEYNNDRFFFEQLRTPEWGALRGTDGVDSNGAVVLPVACKLYLDVDLKPPPEDPVAFSGAIQAYVESMVHLVLGEGVKVYCDIWDASNEKKFSQHFVYNLEDKDGKRLMFATFDHVGVFVKGFLLRLEEYQAYLVGFDLPPIPSEANEIDPAVYTKNRNFRPPMCSKSTKPDAVLRRINPETHIKEGPEMDALYLGGERTDVWLHSLITYQPPQMTVTAMFFDLSLVQKKRGRKGGGRKINHQPLSFDGASASSSSSSSSTSSHLRISRNVPEEFLDLLSTIGNGLPLSGLSPPPLPHSPK